MWDAAGCVVDEFWGDEQGAGDIFAGYSREVKGEREAVKGRVEVSS